MALHLDKASQKYHEKDPECPYCFGEEWETNGFVQNGMIVRHCSSCGESYTDVATTKEQKHHDKFNKKA